MRITFTQLMASVLASLGLKAFSKDENGKSVLTEEQRKELTDKFGEKFVAKFSEDLAKEQDTEDVYEQAALQLEQNKLRAEQEKNAKEMKELREKLAAADAKEAEYKRTLEAKDEEIAKMEKEPVGNNAVIDNKGNAGMAKKFKANMALSYNQHFVKAYNGIEAADYSFGTTTDVSDLTTEFGKYVRDEKLDIIHRLLIQTESIQEMTSIITNKTEVQAESDNITSVLQSFVPKWTPKGAAKFTPLTIRNFKCKLNVPITPSDIMESVLGYLYDEKLKPEEMPIVKYITQQLIFPKLDEEREYAIATGVFKKSTATKDGDAAGEASNAMNGYLSILAAEKLATKTAVNFMDNTVAITSANIISKVQDFCKMFTAVYKKRDMQINIDPDMLDMYKAAMRAKYPNVVLTDDLVVKIEDKNAHFKALEGMRGTGCMFSTPKENFKHIFSQDPQRIPIYMQTDNYDVKVFGEWWEGTGFWIADAIFAFISSSFITTYKTAAGITTGSEAGA